MSQSHLYQTRVEFRDTDAAGIVHFSVYFNYMEEAEHALVRAAGLEVFMEDEDGEFSWPRVAARCEYSAPYRFGDEVEVATTITKLSERSVTYHHEFRLEGKPVASGEITTVCCALGEGGTIRSRAMPSEVSERLAPFVVA